MFAAIGAALGGKPQGPDADHDIAAPWPDHRIAITSFSPEALEEEFGYPHDHGIYQVETSGPRFGGARWDFRQEDLDALITAAIRVQPRPTPPA